MSIAESQRRFYDDLYRQFGNDPRSLSWRDLETQSERFARITRLFMRETSGFTVHEIGCGLGHFGDYLRKYIPQASYSGSDIVSQFVEACRARFPQGTFMERDVAASPTLEKYDFVTLSGTFNLPLQASPSTWQQFIFQMLTSMYRMCRKGIAANFLTVHADRNLMQEHLHYQDEGELLDHIVSNLSRHFELDHGGPLYEYTVCVFRPDYVQCLYPGSAFAKYFKGRTGEEGGPP